MSVFVTVTTGAELYPAPAAVIVSVNPTIFLPGLNFLAAKDQLVSVKVIQSIGSGIKWPEYEASLKNQYLLNLNIMSLF